jgi:hypothetical protein
MSSRQGELLTYDLQELLRIEKELDFCKFYIRKRFFLALEGRIKIFQFFCIQIIHRVSLTSEDQNDYSLLCHDQWWLDPHFTS